MANPVTEIDIRTTQAKRNLEDLKTAFAGAGTSAERLNDALTTQNQTYLKLAASSDPVAKARLQYEQIERRAGAAMDANKITAEQYSRVLDQQVEKIKAVAQRQTDLAGAAKATDQGFQGFLATAGKATVVALVLKEIYDVLTGVQRAIAAAGDQARMLAAQTNLATESLLGGAKSFSEVARLAQASGAPLEVTANLFSRIGRSAADAGITSVSEVSKITETIQKLAITSGATAEESKAAALQLGQALASGRLQGDELRSVLENMPALARLIAKEFGVGVGQLRDMGAAGDLVADRVLKAISNGAEEANRQFERFPKTVERASQQMATSWQLFLSKLDETFNVSARIVKSLENASGLISKVGNYIAPSPESQLAEKQGKLAELDGQSKYTLRVKSGFADLKDAETRKKLMAEILDLENQIGAKAVAAEQDDSRRLANQIQGNADLVASEKRRFADQEKAAQAYYAGDKKRVAEKEAWDKAASEASVRYAKLEKADRDALIALAGNQAVLELRLKDAQDDRAKAASTAAREAEQNAKASLKAAEDEQQARDKALTSVDEQIDKLNAEAAAVQIGARERAVLAERLKAETELKKGLIDVDQELYQWELKRVEEAAGAKFDAETQVRERDKLEAEAKRTAERQAEAAERPWQNLFDNLQRGAAEMFDAWLAGTANFGDTVIKVIRRAASEFASASLITPFFQNVGTYFGVGGKKYDASSPGSSSGASFSNFLPSPTSFLSTNAINSFGATLGFSAAPTAVGGWTVAGVGGPAAAGLNAGAGGLLGTTTLASALPYIGAAVAVAGLAMSLFGKKPSVGPGGGAQFGIGADGVAKLGITDRDNGYDPAANQAAADAVGSAAQKFFEKIGGKFNGTAISDVGGYLGYDAGLKKYIGGASQGDAGRYDTQDQASQAALAGVIRNANVTGLGANLTAMIGAVTTPADLDALLAYVTQLNALSDAFKNWAPPLTAAEAAINQLNASFDQAKSAATELGKPIDDLTKSYDKQKAYMVEQFNQPLIDRAMRATGNAAGADIAAKEREYADLRKQAAVLGQDAVLQVEKTIAAERMAAQRSAAMAQAQTAKDLLQQQLGSLTEELKAVNAATISGLTQTRDMWLEIVRGLQNFRDSLLVGKLSPLSPQQQMIEAQRQFADAVAKAKAGDTVAAGRVQGLAQTALEQTQGYYASSQPYADYFQSVQDQLAGLGNSATAQASAADQQLSVLRGTQAAARDANVILQDIAATIRAIGLAQTNIVNQAFNGNAAQASAITGAYTKYLGRDPDAGGAAYYGGQVTSGALTVGQAVAQIGSSAEAQIYGAYQDLLGRAPDAAGQAFYSSLISGGATAEQIRANIMGSDEYKNRPKLDGGGMIGAGVLAEVHRGEMLYTGPEARVLNAADTRAFLGGNDNSALLGAINTLNSQIGQLLRVTAASGNLNGELLTDIHDRLEIIARKAVFSQDAA